jgi:hypothetical protein
MFFNAKILFYTFLIVSLHTLDSGAGINRALRDMNLSDYTNQRL